MSYTLPSDKSLIDQVRHLRGGIEPTPYDRAIARSCARLAIEHYRAELVAAGGVDVEALASGLCRPVAYCTEGIAIEHQHAIVCESAVRDALRTAIAQAVAKERERIAAWLDSHNNATREGFACRDRARELREGADRDE